MEVKRVRIGSLTPMPGNPKNHPPEQIDKLVKSLTEFGWTNPILITADNMIVAGHARHEAAVKAGLKTVPVIVLPFDGDKAKLYCIADNKLSESSWSFTGLADLLGSLDTGESDLTLSGFDMGELEDLATFVGEPQEDKEPSLTKRPECGHEF